MDKFPVARYVRAARAIADLSQRELAVRAGVPHHIVANAEYRPEFARVIDLARLLEAAALHLIVVDDDGREIPPENEKIAQLKDRGLRSFPAHLDVRPGREDWWRDGWPMFFGKTPAHTFDRSRGLRDWRRKQREQDAAHEEREEQDEPERPERPEDRDPN